MKLIIVLLLGDERAGSLGVYVGRLQKSLVLVASLMSGVTIAVSGSIGFRRSRRIPRSPSWTA